MRTVLFALLGLVAVGCAAPLPEEEVGAATQELNPRDLSTFQPYKTLGGTCEGCRAYVDYLELQEQEGFGGRLGSYKVRHCEINATTGAQTPERECPFIEEGQYRVNASAAGGQLRVTIVLTPNGGSPRALEVDDSMPIPSIKSADAVYFGRGHTALGAGTTTSGL